MRRQLEQPDGRRRRERLAPRNGGSRLCRERGANSGGPTADAGAKSWRPGTVVQGFAGNEAPTQAAHRPAPVRKVGASERRIKALPRVRRQLGWPAGRRLLTPGNEKTAEPEAFLVTPRALPRFPDVRLPCRLGCGSRIRSPGSASSQRCFSSRRRTGLP